LGAVSVAAYSYMSLVPVVQPPIMRLLTTKEERRRVMPPVKSVEVSRAARVLLPIVVTIVGGLLAPQGVPLLGTLMLGNLLRESGVVDRLRDAAQNEIANVVTLLLGLCIGATMQADVFLRPQTLLVFGLGFVAIVLDTAAGIAFGKIYGLLSGGRINPLIGAAGISAYPMAAHVEKIAYAIDRARTLGLPVVGLWDSAGARIQEGLEVTRAIGRIFHANSQASGAVPQLSAVMGPCIGVGSYSPALTDVVFMVRGTGQMFITGPAVIKEVLGQEVTPED